MTSLMMKSMEKDLTPNLNEFDPNDIDLGLFYLDDDKNLVKCTGGMLEWCKVMTPEMRRVSSDMVGDVHVSTVFLGMDHNFFQRKNYPVVFETMVFGGEHDQYQERYTSYKKAVEGHARAIRLVKKSNGNSI